MAPKVKNSTIHVSRTIGKTGEMPEPTETSEAIAVHKFETAPAEVTVDYSLTINLGNFESARIGITVMVPCYKEEIDDAYEYAAAWAEQKISQERDIITGKRSEEL